MTTQDNNVDRAAKLDTATLSDALDKLGIVGQCYKIKPRDTDFRMAGRAWTLKYGPAGKPCGTVGDYIDDVAPGSVIVLDNNGRDDCTVWGDILTEPLPADPTFFTVCTATGLYAKTLAFAAQGRVAEAEAAQKTKGRTIRGINASRDRANCTYLGQVEDTGSLNYIHPPE